MAALLGLSVSHAAGFSFSALKLGNGGPDNYIFTAGDRVVPVATPESNRNR